MMTKTKMLDNNTLTGMFSVTCTPKTKVKNILFNFDRKKMGHDKNVEMEKL